MSTESADVINTASLWERFGAGLFVGLVIYVLFLSYLMSGNVKNPVADPSNCEAAIDYVEKTNLGDIGNLNITFTLYAGVCRAFSPDTSIRIQSRLGRHVGRLAIAFVLSILWLIMVGALAVFLVSRIAKGEGIVYRLATQFEEDHLRNGFWVLGFLCTTLNVLMHDELFRFVGHLFSLRWL